MVLFKKVTRHSPRMWGPSIVGYGSYRYTYESGRTGEAPLAGFAIRGRELVVYLKAEGEEQRCLLSKLGKHKMGKSCLYFKRLADQGFMSSHAGQDRTRERIEQERDLAGPVGHGRAQAVDVPARGEARQRREEHRRQGDREACRPFGCGGKAAQWIGRRRELASSGLLW